MSTAETELDFESLPAIQQPPPSKLDTITSWLIGQAICAFSAVAGEDDERDDFDPLGIALARTIWLVGLILYSGTKLAEWLGDVAYEIWSYYFPQTYPPRERRPLGLPVASPELVAQLQAPQTPKDNFIVLLGGLAIIAVVAAVLYVCLLLAV